MVISPQHTYKIYSISQQVLYHTSVISESFVSHLYGSGIIIPSQGWGQTSPHVPFARTQVATVAHFTRVVDLGPKKIFGSKRSYFWKYGLWGGGEGSKLRVQGTDSYPVNECICMYINIAASLIRLAVSENIFYLFLQSIKTTYISTQLKRCCFECRHMSCVNPLSYSCFFQWIVGCRKYPISELYI